MLLYLVQLKKEIKENHKRNIEKIKMNHLRNMGKIYSSFVEDLNTGLNKKIDEIKGYTFRRLRGGGVSLSFIRE